MKINTLEYFVVLAELQSMNKAAKALYVAQPSLSKALGKLESEIGVQLFYRGANGLRLTEAGEKILPEAKQILKYYNGWKELSKLDALEEIEIYTQSVFSHFFLPDILLRFKKAYPNVRIKLNPVLNPGDFISHEIHKPSICLAVCNAALLSRFTEAQGSAPLKLLDGEYQCVFNARSSLAGRESVTIEDLQELYFTMAHFKGTTEDDGFLYPLFQRLFRTIPSSHTMESESLANVISLIVKNPEVFTITYYPVIRLAGGVLQNGLAHVPLSGGELKGAPYLFYSRQAYKQHPALRELVNNIREAAKELQVDSEI